MPVAVAYVRVSTAMQADGTSLDAQRAKVTAWAALMGTDIATVHQDAGISGADSENRPGLQAAVADACRRRCPLVVYSLSRFARNTGQCLAIADRLDRAGADLVSLSERIDTTTAAGKMVFRMLAVLAEFERDQLAERTTMAMGHLRRQGRRISGRLPYGHALAPDGDHLVPIEDEQQVVAWMRELRAVGASYPQIVEALRGRGVPTKTGRPVWTTATVSSVLARAAKVRAA